MLMMTFFFMWIPYIQYVQNAELLNYMCSPAAIAANYV